MKNFLNNLWKKIVDFCKKNPIEVFALPLAFIAWRLSTNVLRWLDPTSATYDYGIFQIIIFSIIQFFVFFSVAWVVFKTIFGTFGRFLKYRIKDEFQSLTGWQKIKVTYAVFFAMIMILAYLSNTVK